MVASGGLTPRHHAGRLLSRAVQVGLAGMILLAAQSTLAAPPRVARLSYTLGPGTKSCPVEQVFRASVRAQADRDLFPAEAAARLRVAVSRRPQDGRYEAVIDLHDEGGLLFHQEIEPLSRCSDVVGTAATLIVNKLDPVHIEREEKVTPPAPLPVAEPQPPPPLPPAVPAEDRLSFHAGLGSWVGIGVAPRPAAGLAVDVGLRWAPLLVSAELRWDPPASAEVGGGALSTWRVLGALVPCGHWSRRGFGVFGCAVVQAGGIWGVNESFPTAPGSNALYFAAGARAGVELMLTPLSPHLGLRLAGDLLAVPSRIAIQIGDAPAWTTPRINGSIGLGALVRW